MLCARLEHSLSHHLQRLSDELAQTKLRDDLNVKAHHGTLYNRKNITKP
jgi:hypothetical protein